MREHRLTRDRHKWRPIPVVGLALALATTLVACTEPPEVGPEIGNMAPDFTLQTVDGENVTLSDFRGKVVIVNFWLSDCKGCVDELPHMQAVLDKRPDRGLVVLAINVTENAAIVKEFVDSRAFTFPVLLDPNGQVSIDYGGLGVPTTFFVDSEGIVRAIEHGAFLSPDELEELLDAL